MENNYLTVVKQTKSKKKKKIKNINNCILDWKISHLLVFKTKTNT